MIENERFYEILRDSGIKAEQYDLDGEVDVEQAAIRNEIFDRMEDLGMVVAIGRTEVEADSRYATYFGMRTAKHYDELRMQVAALPVSDKTPEFDDLEDEAQEKAEKDLERAVGYQEAMVAIITELVYWRRNGGIKDADKTKLHMLTKTLDEFDIDLNNIDPEDDMFVELFWDMVGGLGQE